MVNKISRIKKRCKIITGTTSKRDLFDNPILLIKDRSLLSTHHIISSLIRLEYKTGIFQSPGIAGNLLAWWFKTKLPK